MLQPWHPRNQRFHIHKDLRLHFAEIYMSSVVSLRGGNKLDSEDYSLTKETMPLI